MKGLKLVIKSGNNTDKAAELKGHLEDVIKELSSLCPINRWTVDV